MICKDHRLSRLDDELALSFRSALSKVQDKHPLRQEQKAWLVRRDGCSKVDMQGKEVVDTDCLWFSYQVRTARLKAISMKHAAEPKADKAVHFPPYTGVWGYEFPNPSPTSRYSYILLRKDDINDVKVTFNIGAPADSSEADAGDEVLSKRAILSFFLGVLERPTKRKYDRWSLKHHNELIQYGGQGKIDQPNGNVVTVEDNTDAVCYENFARYLQLSDASGKVLARKSIIYLLNESVSRADYSKKTCDDGSGVGVWERARTDHLVIVPLADGSFLAHSPDANYIVRFDEHLGTRYSNGKRVFVVDTEWIERIKEEVSEGLPYFGRAQEINDKVNQSILDLIK
jgi:uncharacterized protein